eukprot:TRINITY_DN28156_c0_g1_i1.p1 TRINITY_DN28156_c0_g1~~TRINITY_DN28156_c0_g1_i1.p1  ORF type:complete len:203 (+),score=32.30 TRINITY_DN28156_c0_g1_i1:55-663(+)
MVDNDSATRWLEAFEGTEMEPILKGFVSSNFQAEVARFVAERASAFTVTCQDGSHPLVWTQYHQEYRHMFESELQQILQANSLAQDSVESFATFLHYHASTIETSYIFDGLQQGDIDMVLRYLTSSEDYEAFLAVMFAEVRRQQQTSATSQTQELDVTVPEGVAPGETFAAEYLGARYEFAVPDGYSAGMVFRVAVTLPDAS